MSRWPLKTTFFWQETPLLRPLLFVVAGIIAYDHSWISASCFSTVMAMLLLSGLATVSLAVLRKGSVATDGLYAMSFAVFFSSLGWCSYAEADVRNQSSWGGNNIDTGGLSLVRIIAAPKASAATTKLQVAWLANVSAGKATPASGQALLYIYHAAGTPAFAEGDTLLVPAHWQKVSAGGNPFELDNVSIQRRRGVFHQQFLSQKEVMVAGKFKAINAPFLTRIHHWADRQLHAYVPDSAALGLLQAMLLGDEGGFDPELRAAYSQTGIIHIVSISGSHVAVLFGVVTWMFRRLRGRRGEWLKFMVGLALVWTYVLVAGAPPSALRSALMFTVLVGSGLSRREGQPLNTLLSAALALLVVEPAWLFSVGFQLSFGAVLSMMLFYTPIYRLWYQPKKSWVTDWLWKAVAASLAAELLTAPLVIYYFHNFPLLFIAANILAAFMAGVCALVGGLSIIAFCWIPPLASLLGVLVTLVVKWFNKTIGWMQGFNVTALQHLRLNVPELLLFYFLLTGLGIWWLKKLRAGMFVALSAACALAFLLTIDAYNTQRQVRLIVYNNGKMPVVEMIHGSHFTTLAGSGDSYNINAAHTGFGAWRKWNDTAPDQYFSFAGKRVVIVSDSSIQSYGNPLPADVLILARPLRQIRIANFLATFMPKEIVLAVRPSPYHMQRWADSCAAHRIRLHNVATEGAYMQ